MTANSKPSLLVQRILSLLKNELDQLEPGMPLLPEVELADKFGVGRKTIRSAMAVLQGQGMIRRIKGKGTFPAQGHQATTLFRARTKRIAMGGNAALATQNLTKGFYELMLGGAYSEAIDNNSELVLFGGKDPEKLREACYRVCDDPHIDGVVLVSVTDQELLNDLAGRGRPLCLLDHYTEEADMDCVRVDSFGGSRMAVEHLYRLGHRRIGYFHPDRPGLNPLRFEGYRSYLREMGLPYSEKFVIHASGTVESGEKAAMDLLSIPEKERPTAVLTFSNDIAIGAIRTITEFGLQVPEQFSVIGTGGPNPPDRANIPELTSIQFNTYEPGKLGVKYVLERINDPELDIRNTIVPAHLHLGSSTAQVFDQAQVHNN